MDPITILEVSLGITRALVDLSSKDPDRADGLISYCLAGIPDQRQAMINTRAKLKKVERRRTPLVAMAERLNTFRRADGMKALTDRHWEIIRGKIARRMKEVRARNSVEDEVF